MKHYHMKSFFLSFFLLSVLLLGSFSCAFAEDADVLFEEGLQYLLGSNGVEQDLVKGITMIVEAANKGSPGAMVQVGVMYHSGLGKMLSDDFEEGSEADYALAWYEKAADAGGVEAAAEAISRDAFSYFLGSEDGSIQEDDATALKYFEKAAEYGDSSAINMMVAFYTYGFGVEQDPDKALELGSRLAEQGDPEALASMEEYAYAYYSGEKDGISINYATAFRYYEKLTEYGNERAMYNLGLLYEHGLGVSADHEKAIEWFTKAQNAGYAPAGVMLSELTKTE